MEPTIDLNVTEQTEQTHEVFVAQNHVVSMLRRRGFRVESKPWHRDYEAFMGLWAAKASHLALAIVGTRDDDDNVLVFWPFDEKVRIATIREMLELARDKGYRHVILVHSGVITPFAANHMALEKDHEMPLRVETFTIKSFQYDLMAHRLVPDAKVLSVDEEKAFLAAKRVTKKELSKILTVDPVAKYLGMRPGQVLRTERPAMEGYFYYHWRVCAKGTVKK